ncbi:peptidase dimerization domain protein [Tannerella forsythia KS16]|uniref:Peptidase dimerization domain protein n=2 Tax=Tannerella forsythia TaxID=28112 RepID=G8UMD5_TANFA|nr:dipeptidase [Tannerella forsythia]AEW22341.1 peptidase dimerization domain protein [Tannerella forsythia 92A2]KKY61574.1 peptidase M20 [Tannerella forsythia]OLQ20995.1 peptidase M20 [Tannerella forsythia]PDP43349.1 peptidase M20 [Tannerella forsythia]PDP70009.1 peptidase M20 [Tannerella forsythia]
MEIRTYIERHKDRFRDEWFSLLRIPSVSSQSEHKADMVKCAERWKELLLASGATRAEVMPTAGNPVVYAERIVSASAPTVLVYGHYDVMPPEPLELWKSNPFEPEIRDGRVYARGADDDKGQAMIQVKGFETALQTGILNCNLKFILEGEEEIGSISLGDFCAANKELLAADVILVSDTSMVSEETPSLTTGLRGLSYWEVEVTGPNRDLHSGHFGGAVANPINVLCKLIADITDADGRITIPGFYDDVEELSDTEKAMLAQVPFSETKYKQAIDVDELFGEKGYSTLERNSCRPSFDVCGIWGGYTGEGAKTVLPSKAYAKLSCRLVPNQQPDKITQLMIDHLVSVAPRYVKIKVVHKHDGDAYVCPIDLPAYKAAEKGFTIAFGKQPLAVRRGGSIPIIPAFEKILGMKSVLMGFGLERNAIHSPNESFGLDMFYTGIEAVAEFYNHYRP